MVVYIKNNISFVDNIVHLKNAVNISEVRIGFNNKNITISSIYRSPSLNTFEFLDDIEDYVSGSKNTNNRIHIVIGNMSIDIRQITLLLYT